MLSVLLSRMRPILACALLACVPVQLLAGPPSEVLARDLAPLIDQAAVHPHRFAVEIPHAMSTTSHGQWTTLGANSVWRYTVRIPGAVSMSFHAPTVSLPASGKLRVTAGDVDYTYGPRDVGRGGLWSRIARGDTLAFELTVATRDLGQLQFSVSGLQAGYRHLGGSGRNHPHYDTLQAAQAAATQGSACVENWSCHADSINSGPAQATVAILIGNVGQCTGVLLNDVPNDLTPYVLTARHCENGDADGGAPGAAATVSVYWDATVPCANALGTIYDPGTAYQFGASTVVEQQDAWLIRLNAPPAAVDPYYAGWDASTNTIVGGFTTHHAQGQSRQFTGWFGQAAYGVIPAAQLNVHFDSTVWGTANAVGSGGAGASGSGLFDSSGHLRGVLIRGIEQSAAPGFGVCPASPLVAPSLSSATSLATALSGIFNSTADPKSTTGSVTLQSVLDPGHSGLAVLDGHAVLPTASVTVSATSAPTGDLLSLSWQSTHATSCVASGGESGDGWAGSVARSGSVLLTSLDGGTLTYTLTCTSATTTVITQGVVTWTLSTPYVSVYQLASDQTFGVPFTVGWNANLRPCAASGGNAGDGWSGSKPVWGQSTVTESVVGSVTYTLTCGSGSRTTTGQVTVPILGPGAQLTADATTLLVGQTVQLFAIPTGRPCQATGGTAGDGWVGTTFFNAAVPVTENVPGTYTYTLSCGSGGHVATAQVTVNFVNGAPHATLSASASSVPYNTAVNFSWDANVGPCLLSFTGPISNGVGQMSTSPHASATDYEPAIGQYVYTINCGTGTKTAQASTTVTYTGTPFLTIAPGPVLPVAGAPFMVQYRGNLAPCALTGGGTGDGWSGTTNTLAIADINLSEATASTFTYIVKCGSGAQALQAQTSVTFLPAAPYVTVNIDQTTQGVGLPLHVSWNSDVSPCQSAGGTASDGWAGTVPSSGTRAVTETTVGTYAYYVNCGTGPSSASGFAAASFVTLAPPTLTATPPTAVAGQPVTLSWHSSDGASCTATGGEQSVWNDGWAGARAANGTYDVRENAPGDYVYFIYCGTSAVTKLTVTFTSATPIALPPAPPPPPPTVQLGADVSSVTVGNPVTLSWTADIGDTCTVGGGNASDGWSGTVAARGTQPVRESSAGTYVYSITCSTTGQTATAISTVTITVNAASAPLPTVTVAGNSGGGGGGALGWLEFASLGTAVIVQLSRRKRRGRLNQPRSLSEGE